MHIPSKEEIISGCREFKIHEKRDSMYKVASYFIQCHWGKPEDMTDGLAVLLLSWNQAFYGFGGELDYNSLEKFLDRNLTIIESFRQRDISSLSHDDEKIIQIIFNDLLDVLKIESRKGPKKSPVGVAKALHLLCPNFFPIWDLKIAKAYKCYYNKDPAGKYLKFCEINKNFSEIIQKYDINSNKPLLKIIDEYNYSKFTKGWI